jgi:hypothetical protein
MKLFKVVGCMITIVELAWAWSLVEDGSNVVWWEGGENRLFIFFHEH